MPDMSSAMLVGWLLGVWATGFTLGFFAQYVRRLFFIL